MAKEKAKKSGGIGKWFKEIIAELKKVTWAPFKDVVKKTSIVLGVTLFFLAAVMVIDFGLGSLYNLLIESWK